MTTSIATTHMLSHPAPLTPQQRWGLIERMTFEIIMGVFCLAVFGALFWMSDMLAQVAALLLLALPTLVIIRDIANYLADLQEGMVLEEVVRLQEVQFTEHLTVHGAPVTRYVATFESIGEVPINAWRYEELRNMRGTTCRVVRSPASGVIWDIRPVI